MVLVYLGAALAIVLATDVVDQQITDDARLKRVEKVLNLPDCKVSYENPEECL